MSDNMRKRLMNLSRAALRAAEELQQQVLEGTEASDEKVMQLAQGVFKALDEMGLRREVPAVTKPRRRSVSAQPRTRTLPAALH